MAWTTYQGVDVITDQPAPVRHPRYGRDHPVELKGATLLLLADGTPVVVCDSCKYNGITGYGLYVKPTGEPRPIFDQSDSMLAHVNGMHHPNKANRRTSFYDDDQIRFAIKIWLKWKHTNVKNWTQRACEELDDLGRKPFRGDHWTTGQLGSLVREYIRKPGFNQLKAAPLTDENKAYLATLVRDAAATASAEDVRARLLASNVRITEKKQHEHKPVDFDAIIKEQEAAKAAQQEDEAAVPVGNPVLTFGPREETQVMVVTVPSTPAPAPRVVDTVGLHTPAAPAHDDSPFRFIVELPDGSPMFTYGGLLMVGKVIKDVQI